MRNGEHQLQVECVRWFRLQYPKLAGLLFAIPNGGLRNIKVATKLKAEGVLPGVPDLFLAFPNGACFGFFIEMKFGKNDCTEAQKIMQNILKFEGYEVVTCWSFDEFKNQIEKYLGYL
jgi:hypothetical protein